MICYGTQLILMFSLNMHIGGVIFSKKIILIAAHCNAFLWFGSYYIRAGSDQPEEGGILIDIHQWIFHDKYDPSTYAFDMALIELEEELGFTDIIKPIQLITESFVQKDGFVVKSAGFGDTCNGCGISDQLMEAVLTTCTALHKTKRAYEVICAEDLDKKQSCK